MGVVKEAFGAVGGNEFSLYTITNSQGTQVKVSDFGATLVSILFQDKNEVMRDVILGYDSAEAYMGGTFYFGAVIGRSGNRIDKARFMINGKEYQLDVNDNENNLHSGTKGFEKRRWDVEAVTEDSVTFALQDADMEQGYPGNFACSITYTLTEENALRLTYRAKSDKDTVMNMTNHAYFNLDGHDGGSVFDQELMLKAKYYTPVRDSQAIPTGEIAPVAGTPMDFSESKPIGRDINADFQQLKYVGGYDHNFVMKEEKGAVELFARAYSPKTGICMEGFSDLPGFQFYVCNFTGAHPGKGGTEYLGRCAFCLETQYFPNSINQEGFASPILKAGEEFESTTVYRFSVK